MDAGLRLWRTEDELGFAAFLGDGVVAGDGDLSVGLAIRTHAVAEQSVVDGIGGRCHGHRRSEPHRNQSLEEMLDSGSLGGTHAPQIIRVPQSRRARRNPSASLGAGSRGCRPHIRYIRSCTLTTCCFHRQTDESSLAALWRAPTGHSKEQVRV